MMSGAVGGTVAIGPATVDTRARRRRQPGLAG